MELNCLGEVCPVPVIKTKNALKELGENGVLSVLTDNIEAVENIGKMAAAMGLAYTSGESGGNFVITITKGAGGESPSGAANIKNGAVILIASDKMGSGDDELGAALLKAFLYSLTEADVLPQAVVFYNGGVRMTTEGSAALDTINALSAMGVDILSCGACLGHYGLTDSLRAGRISNMYEIAGLALNAASVIRP